MDSTLARVRCVPLLVALALALAAPGCGDDDEGNGGGGGGSDALRDAVAKTEAAKTARMDFTISVSGSASERYPGEVLVDFEHDRNHLTMDVEGQTVELFADGDDEYFRVGSSGRYLALPESEQAPVANNPTDSLQYVGTDVVDVSEGDPGCYEGMLDFDRVFERVEEGRESEFPEELREAVRLRTPGAARAARPGRTPAVSGLAPPAHASTRSKPGAMAAFVPGMTW